MMSSPGNERELIASIEAERAILGGCLLENACFYEAAAKLTAQTFALDSHRRTFHCMGELISAGKPVDIVTLVEELKNRKELEGVGGAAYLASLTEGLPRRLSISAYVDVVRNKWELRAALVILLDGVARVSDQAEDASRLIPDIDSRLLSVCASSQSERSLEDQADAAFQELQDIREGKIEPGVSSSIPSLDRIIAGYKRKKLYVVGGRPSQGKTSLMIQATIQHCARNIRTRLISLEMEAEELLQRIYAAAAEVPYELAIDPASLSANQWVDLENAKRLVKTWPLEIDARPDQDIDSALAGARLSCRRRGTSFVAADYAQIFRFTGEGKLRHQEISDVAKKLRDFAKAENIPVMLLSSITEVGERNPNQRPTLSHLRGSGDLAFHADVAILIHRERGEDGATILPDGELIVAKQRGGRTGTANVTYNTDTLLFDAR